MIDLAFIISGLDISGATLVRLLVRLSLLKTAPLVELVESTVATVGAAGALGVEVPGEAVEEADAGVKIVFIFSPTSRQTAIEWELPGKELEVSAC